MGLVDFIVDQSRRAKTSDIADQVASGQLDQAGALMKYAQATGDPDALKQAGALKALQGIDLGNPNAAVPQLVKAGLLSADQGLTFSTNPNMGLRGLMALNQPDAQNPAPAAPAPAATGQPATAQPSAPKGIDLDYLNRAKQISPLAGTMAENMIAGTFEPESGKGQNDPIYVAAMQIARRVDPSFNPQSLMGRPAMVKNATSGKMYSDSVNMNSVAGHLYDLHAAAPGLQNGNIPMVNSFRNTMTEATGSGGFQPISQYEAILQRAAPELNKFYVGGEGDAAGREHAGDPFHSNLPLPVINNNIQTQLGLLKSKAGALQHEYDTTMGTAGNRQMLSPTARALMDDIDGKPLTKEQQDLVNHHRTESNLPPKTWKEQQSDKPQITKEDALAELRRRGKIK